jgi:hypothetical protein
MRAFFVWPQVLHEVCDVAGQAATAKATGPGKGHGHRIVSEVLGVLESAFTAQGQAAQSDVRSQQAGVGPAPTQQQQQQHEQQQVQHEVQPPSLRLAVDGCMMLLRFHKRTPSTAGLQEADGQVQAAGAEAEALHTG